VTPPKARRGGAVAGNPRRLALRLMRDMKRVLLETVRTWDVSPTVTDRGTPTRRTRVDRRWTPDGYVHEDVEYEVESWTTRDRRPDECPENSPEQWLLLWHTATNLRDSADRLAAFCQQEHMRTGALPTDHNPTEEQS
jgi:hypothetical protein